MNAKASEIIVTHEDDGVLTSWQKINDRWYQVRANEYAVLRIIESPFKSGRPPFILEMDLITPQAFDIIHECEERIER